MKLDVRIKKKIAAFQLDVAIQADGASIVLWGASGAGKTLTLNCLAGFSRPDSGRILLGDDLFYDGATGVHVPPRQRRCAYLFQDHALFPHMTVLENLSFAASVSKQQRPKQKMSGQRINDLLEAFELAELSHRKPAQLSGGQQQRAALARALVCEPRMLLLDEPTQGLDARLKRAFFEVLQETKKRTDALIVIVTHDLDECFEIGESICLLAGGKVLQSGVKEAVFARPASVEVARSLGIYNVLPAEIESLDPSRNLSRLRMLGNSWTGPYFPGHLLGDQGFAVFRETAVTLAGGTNATPIRVTALKPFSRGVRLQLEGGLNAVTSEAKASQIRPGTAVSIHLPPDDMVFLSK